MHNNNHRIGIMKLKCDDKHLASFHVKRLTNKIKISTSNIKPSISKHT